MRKLNSFELQFWNNTSISILIDAGFTVEINDGIIVGIGDYDGREIIYAYYFMYSFSDLVGINVFCVLAKRILSYKYCLLLNNEEGNTYQLFLKDCTTTSNNPACKCCN